MQFETFYIIDLDRTLIRTDDLRELFEDVITSNSPIDREEIHKARMLVKSNFDMVAFVYGRLTEQTSPERVSETMAQLREKFVKTARVGDYLEPYAGELIKQLRRRQLPFGILTAGGNDWQQAKIEAVGLEGTPHLIVQTTHKGTLIASWRRFDSTYQLPDKLAGQAGTVAKSLVFIDDREVSFVGIPPDVRAIRVLSATAGEPQEVEEGLPLNVEEITGIDGVLRALFG